MRPNRVRPPEGATLVISILGVAILAVLVGYSIGNWALGLLLSPRTELQTSSSLGTGTTTVSTSTSGISTGASTGTSGTSTTTSSSYTYTAVGSTDSGNEDLTDTKDDKSGSTEVVVRGPYVVGEVELYKVRVGDFFTRQDAEAVRDQLKAMGYTDSYVPPGEDAYAVQVGAFGSEENANSLAQALLSKGFDVYIVEQIKQ